MLAGPHRPVFHGDSARHAKESRGLVSPRPDRGKTLEDAAHRVLEVKRGEETVTLDFTVTVLTAKDE